MAFANILSSCLLPETMTECRRVVADGGVIIDQRFMDRTIHTLKAQGIYSSCKFLADANFAVKKDGSNAVSTLYDISGNNNDAVQATGANQPIWTAAQQNGKAGLVFDGTSDFLSHADTDSLDISINISIISTFNLAIAGHEQLVSKGASWNTGYGILILSSDAIRFALQGVTPSELNQSGTISPAIPYCLSSIYSGAVSAVYINNTLNNSVSATGSITTNANDLQIGAEAARFFYKGNIFNMGIFSTALSTAQRQAMESLINGYYAIY